MGFKLYLVAAILPLLRVQAALSKDQMQHGNTVMQYARSDPCEDHHLSGDQRSAADSACYGAFDSLWHLDYKYNKLCRNNLDDARCTDLRHDSVPRCTITVRKGGCFSTKEARKTIAECASKFLRDYPQAHREFGPTTTQQPQGEASGSRSGGGKTKTKTRRGGGGGGRKKG